MKIHELKDELGNVIHACATASLPLPDNHWIYAEPVEPEQVNGVPRVLRTQVRDAMRYAIQVCTSQGKDTDFDPDAMCMLMERLLADGTGEDSLATPAAEQSPHPEVFPNPLMIQMGEGRLMISRFWDRDDADGGILLSDTGEKHEIGSEADIPADDNYAPRAGDVFLRFGCKKSAEAFQDVLKEVIDGWPSD